MGVPPSLPAMIDTYQKNPIIILQRCTELNIQNSSRSSSAASRDPDCSDPSAGHHSGPGRAAVGLVRSAAGSAATAAATTGHSAAAAATATTASLYIAGVIWPVNSGCKVGGKGCQK